MRKKLSEAQQTYLDLVRGASALVVLVGHTFFTMEGVEYFGKLHAWQSFPVVVFFWLSGFLIAYNCFVREQYEWSDYR